MKLRSIISALIVFTLVMTCAMSAVSAAQFAAQFATTTTYSTKGEVTVSTTATGLEAGTMVSYIIYEGDEPTESSIKYIDQDTVAKDSNSVNFSVTDVVDKLNGKKIHLGSSVGSLGANITGKDDVVTGNTGSTLIVSLDPVPANEERVIFLVNQFGSSKQTGLNVYAKDAAGNIIYEFMNLMNMSSNNSYYAIELVDESDDKILSNVATYEAKPVFNGAELKEVVGTSYWKVAE